MTGGSGSEIRTLRLETLRTARVALLGGSATAREGLDEVWYVLHGYRQLAHRFLPRFVRIAGNGRLVVAPEAGSRFYVRRTADPGHSSTVGASWMTREDREHEIRDYVRYLNRVARTVEEGRTLRRRVVLGFSQGAHTAARWAVMGRIRVDRLVLWGAAIPPDLPAQSAGILRDVDLVLVRGAEDGLRRAEEEAREEAWLEEAGLAYRIVEHPGGHEVDPGVLEELAEGS